MIFYYRNNIYNIIFLFLSIKHSSIDLINNQYMLVDDFTTILINDHLYFSPYNLYFYNIYKYE